VANDKNPRSPNDVVKKGGVAPDDAAVDDVTRDTYGFTGTKHEAETADDHEAARRRAEEVLGLDTDTEP
jgi:hypothetical protein